MTEDSKIICAMSGGVDSSVSALLLKRSGLEVIGVTMKLWDCFKKPLRQTCCSSNDTLDAARVCGHLRIPHHVLDVREAFRKEVVKYFVREYSRGRTPNPCIKCNETLKFGLLREECKKIFGTDIVATGHYARIGQDGENGCYGLLKGRDPNKDQSYFLWTLTQEQLSKSIFPLGNLTKEEVRRLARDAGLDIAKKRESQEVCFIPDDDYAGFMRDYFPEMAGPAGNFVDKGGKILGRHQGIHAYTIGQRRGLGLGFGERKYVVGIDLDHNQIILGENSDLMRTEVTVEGVNWIKSRDNIIPSSFRGEGQGGGGLPLTVKIRYRHAGGFAVVTSLPDNCARIKFSEPQRAITPGQAAVFYNGDEVVGGGWIVTKEFISHYTDNTG